MRTIIVIFMLALMFTSCGNHMTYQEYMHFCTNPENGLVQQKTINGVNYKLSYRPKEIMLHQHLKASDSISKEKLNKLSEHYGNYHHLLLSVSKGDREALKTIPDFISYSAIMQKFGFGMDKQVYMLTEERDTLNLIDFHFSRYYGMGKSNDVLLIFEKEKGHTNKLTIHLNEMGFNTGNTRFSFNCKQIEKVKYKRIIKEK